MKKFLCLFLSAIMLLGLCGCLGNNDDVRGDITNNDQSQTESSNSNNNSSNDSSNNSSNDKEPEFSLGKATGSTYNNDFLGLSCTLPSGWRFYSDKEILALNNLAGEYYDDSVLETIKNANIIYDMFAENQAEGMNVNINLEKHTLLEMASIDVKKTLEAQAPTIKSSFQNMGYTDIQTEYQKTTVDGKEFDSLRYTAKIQGIDYYGVVISFKKGNYLASLTVSSLVTDNTSTILGYFDVK